MRKIICILGIALTIICLANVSSCEKAVYPELSILQDTLRVPSEGGEYLVVIVSNVIWNIENPFDASWITVDTSDKTGLGVAVSPNNTAAIRQHVLKIKTETIRKSIVVIQDTEIGQTTNRFRH